MVCFVCTIVIFVCALPATPFLLLFLLFRSLGLDDKRDANDYEHPMDGLQVFTIASFIAAALMGFRLVSSAEEGISPPHYIYYGYACFLYIVSSILLITAFFVRHVIRCLVPKTKQ
jgi:hypothetical protein